MCRCQASLARQRGGSQSSRELSCAPRSSPCPTAICWRPRIRGQIRSKHSNHSNMNHNSNLKLNQRTGRWSLKDFIRRAWQNSIDQQDGKLFVSGERERGAKKKTNWQKRKERERKWESKGEKKRKEKERKRRETGGRDLGSCLNQLFPSKSLHFWTTGGGNDSLPRNSANAPALQC